MYRVKEWFVNLRVWYRKARVTFDEWEKWSRRMYLHVYYNLNPNLTFLNQKKAE
jgi:hypothetical protein